MASNRDSEITASSAAPHDSKHYTPQDGSHYSDAEAQPVAHTEKINNVGSVQVHAPTTQYLCKIVVSKDAGAFFICLGMSLSATLLLRLNHLPARICEAPLATTLSHNGVVVVKATSLQDTWAPDPCITAFAIVWYVFGVLGGIGSLGGSTALGWLLTIGISWGMVVGWWMGFTVIEALVFLIPWIPLASFVLLGCVHAVYHIRKQQQQQQQEEEQQV